MRSQPIRSHPCGDGSPRTAHPHTRPPLQASGARPCRRLHAGQTRCCSACGDRTELCPHAGRRLVALHPAGSAATEVPEDCREQLSAGIARPRGDRIDWCRSSRRLFCPRRAVTSRARPQLEAMGLRLALRTRRAIDTGVHATSATTSRSARPSAAVARPVVCILRNLCPGNTPAGKVGCCRSVPAPCSMLPARPGHPLPVRLLETARRPSARPGPAAPAGGPLQPQPRFLHRAAASAHPTPSGPRSRPRGPRPDRTARHRLLPARRPTPLPPLYPVPLAPPRQGA